MAKITGTAKDNRLEGSKNNDLISGGGGNDRISGHQGDDVIRGDAGNDRIGGGQGHDILTGGAGKDIFVFRSFASKDSDHVADFTAKTDKLQFDSLIFKLEIGKLDPDAFFAGTKARDAEDRFVYDQKTGRLYFDDDGTGAHAQKLVAILDNHAKLSVGDFIIS